MKALILFGVLLIAGAATYLIRLSFIALEGRMNLPMWFRSALPYVPAAMLTALIAPDLLMRDGALAVSARTGAGIEELVTRICAAAGAGEALADAPMVSNLRHVGLLERARASVRHASDSVGKMGRLASEEFVLADLQSARSALEEVTGARTPDDVLVHIFSRFCVGK